MTEWGPFGRVWRWVMGMILHRCPMCRVPMERWDVYGGWVRTRNYICPVCQYDTKYDGCWVEHGQEEP